MNVVTTVNRVLTTVPVTSLRHGLDDRDTAVRKRAEEIVQSVSGALPTSYSMSTGGRWLFVWNSLSPPSIQWIRDSFSKGTAAGL